MCEKVKKRHCELIELTCLRPQAYEFVTHLFASEAVALLSIPQHTQQVGKYVLRKAHYTSIRWTYQVA